MHVRHMQNYQLSLSNMQMCDVLSLSWMLSSQILNTVAKHITSNNKRKLMLNVVEDNVGWKSNFVQHYPTVSDVMAKQMNHVQINNVG